MCFGGEKINVKVCYFAPSFFIKLSNHITVVLINLEISNGDDDAAAGLCMIFFLLYGIYCCCCNCNKNKERQQAEALVNGVMNMADDNIRMQIQMAEMKQRLAWEEQRRMQMEYTAFCLARQEEERRRQAMSCYNRRPW